MFTHSKSRVEVVCSSLLMGVTSPFRNVGSFYLGHHISSFRVFIALIESQHNKGVVLQDKFESIDRMCHFHAYYIDQS